MKQILLCLLIFLAIPAWSQTRLEDEQIRVDDNPVLTNAPTCTDQECVNESFDSAISTGGGGHGDGTNCSTLQFAKGVDASGNAQCQQPAFTDLAGSATDDQVPNTITVNVAESAKKLEAGTGGNLHDVFFNVTSQQWCVDVDGSGGPTAADLSACLSDPSGLGSGESLQGYAFHYSDICDAAVAPENADCGGPDNALTDEDLQRMFYELCKVESTAFGETCPTIILPSGQYDWDEQVFAGDQDNIPGTFGIDSSTCVGAGNPIACCTGSGTGTCELDLSDGPVAPLDGRLFGLRLIGQGRSPVINGANDSLGGTTIRWTGGNSPDFMLDIRGAENAEVLDIAFRADDEGTGDTTGDDAAHGCLRVQSTQDFGRSAYSKFRISCIKADRIAVQLTDLDGMEAIGDPTRTLNTTLSGPTETAVVVTSAIPTNLPTTGRIGVVTNAGQTRWVNYTSWTGSTFMIASSDWSSTPATAPKTVFLTINGRSESIDFDLIVQHSPIAFQQTTNNTQGNTLRLHVEQYGVDANTATFLGTDPDSCGGGSGENDGSAAVACAIDHREGDLKVVDTVSVSGVADPNDWFYHGTRWIKTTEFENTFHELNNGLDGNTGDYFTIANGLENRATGAPFIMRGVNIFDKRTTGDAKCLETGTHALYIVDGMRCRSDTGGNPSFRIDTLGGTTNWRFGTHLSITGLVMNSGQTSAGSIVFDIAPDANDTDVTGFYQYLVACKDNSPADGICDFDTTTEVNKSTTVHLGDIDLVGPVLNQIDLEDPAFDNGVVDGRISADDTGDNTAIVRIQGQHSGGLAPILTGDADNDRIFLGSDSTTTFDRVGLVTDSSSSSADLFCDAAGAATTPEGRWCYIGNSIGTVASADPIATVKLVYANTSSPISPSAKDMWNGFFECDHATPTSDCDYSLPSAVAGMNACFYDNGEGTGGIIIDPDVADSIILNGTALTAGNAIDSPGVAGAGANGDYICLVAISVAEWVTTHGSGTWVDGGTD